MSKHIGSCLCGSVTFEVECEFQSFYLCHCRYCQKDTGSAHAANLFCQSANLTWLSGKNSVKTFTLPNTLHSKSFCQYCGSALPNTQNEQTLVVPAGCLDSNVDVSPTAHIFMSRKAVWDKDLDDYPKFEKLPDQ